MADPIATTPKGLNRPSKFSQTLSSLKAIIHRKTKDDNAVANKNPYPAQYSKINMSQPILVLSNPNRPNIGDADDVSSPVNTYPAPPILGHAHKVSSSLNTYPAPQVLGHAHKVSTASNSSNSFNDHDGAIKTQPNGGAASIRSLATSGTCHDSIPNSLKPAAVRGLVKPTHVGLAFEKSPLTAPSELLQVPLAPAVPLSLSSASSGDTIGPNVQAATSAPKVNKFYTSTEPPVLLLYSSTPTLSLDSSSVTNDARKGIGSSKRDNDSPLTPPLSVRDVPRRVCPKLTLDTTLNVNNDINNDSIINTASSQQHLFTPIQPRRTVSSAPRRPLPPANYRFSLNLVNGYSGRPSPSVILPPLPLPVSPIGTSTDAVSSRRAKRAGLMSMPALPRQGSSTGTAGREELDDEDDDGTDDDDSTSANSTSTEDEMEPESSGDSSTSETIGRNRSHLCSPSTSSFETELPATPHVQDGYFGDLSRPLERRFSRSPQLPSVDISRIDLSFLDSSQPNNNTDKGKSKELTEDTLKTPIAKRPNKNGGTAGNRTPTAFKRMDFFIPEETATDTWPPSTDSTQRQSRSPIQTPRPGGRFNLPPPVSIPPSPRPMYTRSTNQLSGSMNTISQFPGTYKRASRSLIDVHALETKEKVEQMMREEEENAEKERKRRVKSMRMSTIIVVEDADVPTTPFDQKSDAGDRQLQSLTVSSRIPLASVDGDDKDLEVSSAKKQAKRASKRISMAPAYDTIIPLRKRLSMPTFNSTSTGPPPYPDLFPGPGVKFTQVQPREDEGRERLPLYSNAIYLKAVMPRKLEFTGPGIQAKDRKWKRVLCVLEGTSFKVYKPPGVSALEGWWESKVGTGDLAMQVTTNSSFNSGDVRVEDANEEIQAEVEREKKRIGEATVMANRSQFDDTTLSNQRQGSSSAASGSSSILPAALNVAVHLFIPSSRGHGRTISDAGQPSHTFSDPPLPRISLDIPRNGRSTPAPTIAFTTSLSSSRSSSPTFASSSSLMSTSASSSSSHRSMNSTSIAAGGGHRSDNYSSSTSKGKQRMAHSDLLPKGNSLIKAYTMQHAESGLGTDYVKRKHVIRVRLEGEQFLLQAGNVDNVIEWIEGLQAATNVAMDLDERPMPRGPLFPRRRRRRQPNVPSLIGNQPVDPVDPLQLGPPLPSL